MAKDKWMQDAVKPQNRGKFGAKAKAAGMSTQAFAKAKAGAPGKLGQEARFAETAAKISKGRAGKGVTSRGNK